MLILRGAPNNMAKESINPLDTETLSHPMGVIRSLNYDWPKVVLTNRILEFYVV
jgi:hypothetical protein